MGISLILIENGQCKFILVIFDIQITRKIRLIWSFYQKGQNTGIFMIFEVKNDKITRFWPFYEV